MRRMLARLRRDEAGLSLSELVISSMLTILVLSMVAVLFVQTTKITAASQQTNNSVSIASNVANEITSVLRVATTNLRTGQTVADAAIVSGTRSTLTLYSLSNTNADEPAPVMITYATDPLTQGLIETRCTAKKSGGFWKFAPCGETTTRDLGIGVLPATGTSDQLFTYYDGNDVEMVIGTDNLSDAQRLRVAKIKVQVVALATESRNDPVKIVNTVVLGNLGLNSGATP